MKILVLPRESANRYQALPYGGMRRCGSHVSYLGTVTPSDTLNLLQPELAGQRLTGARLVHLHWIYASAHPGAERFPVLRRVAQAWYTVRLFALTAWTRLSSGTTGPCKTSSACSSVSFFPTQRLCHVDRSLRLLLHDHPGRIAQTTVDEMAQLLTGRLIQFKPPVARNAIRG